jgi:hypothetical protein
VRSASSLAELSTVRIINEPIAILLQNLADEKSEETFIVFDLGFSSSDATLIASDFGIFEILDSDHISFGGSPFLVLASFSLIFFFFPRSLFFLGSSESLSGDGNCEGVYCIGERGT